MTSARAGYREWLGLAVLGLPTLLLALDLSVLYLALPRLSLDLHASVNEQLWITDIYGFVTAGFLLTMGTLGDRIGRRKLLLIGAAGFGAASVIAAYSTSVAMLIAARALLGLAGATLMPSTLALISNMFRDPRQRATAIALWTSCFMVGVAVGPIVGGVLLEHFWWGSLFLLGVPVMALLLATAPFLLPEYRQATGERIDAWSVGISLLAVLLMVSAVKLAAAGGPGPRSLLAGAAGLGAAVAFIARQRRLATPLLDLALFENRAFNAALVIFTVGVAAQSGIMMLVSAHLQLVEGLTPLQAGWSLMPASVAMVVGCLLGPIVGRYVAPARVVSAGLVVSAVGYALIATVRDTGGLHLIEAGAILVFFGIGPMAVFSQDLIVGSAAPDKAGSAAALSEAGGDFGIALGVALLGSVSNAVFTHTMAATPGLPPAEAMAAGLRAAARVSMIVTAVLGVAAATWLAPRTSVDIT
jgi:DHA2 family multidrug resistance protein-like MFS transporter